MTDLELLALAGPPGGELLFTGLIFLIFYVIVFLPMRGKQKKLEQLIKGLKTGDKVIINPGILGTIVGVEDDAFQVRVDDKARLKVLKSAVAGLQPETKAPTEKK
jgi:preprotein translocase subunit YajC